MKQEEEGELEEIKRACRADEGRGQGQEEEGEEGEEAAGACHTRSLVTSTDSL